MPLKNKKEKKVEKLERKLGKEKRNMKYVNKILTVGVSLMTAYTANALGTAAGTVISNQATVDFVVGGVNQTDVNSNTAGFIVDRKIVFTLVKDDADYIDVVPGSSGQVLTYTLANQSNAALDFLLTPNQQSGGTDAFGGTDNIDASAVAAFADENSNGVYNSGTDVDTYVDELAADASVKVFVVSSFASSVVNNDIAGINLQAQAAVGGTASSQGAALSNSAGADVDDGDTSVDGDLWDNSGDIQNVFADATGTGGDSNNDGLIRALDAYQVVTATISVTKSSAVISDPVNGGTNPKRIPGAVVRYTISVSNSGAAQADNLALTDTLDANTTFVPGSIVVDGNAEDDNSTGTDDTPLDGGNPTSGSESGGVVSAGIFALPAAGSKNVVFDVTVD